MSLIIDEELKNLYEGFTKKYGNIPKQIIFCTLQFAKSPGSAFDALEDFSHEYPCTWDHEQQKWVSTLLLEYEIGE